MRNIHRDIDRYRERHTHVAAGAAINLRVDADHFAAHVEQRSAGIARIDRNIGLDERHIAFIRQQTPFGAHDTGGHAVFETERCTDRRYPFTGFDTVRLADSDYRQIAGVYLEQRDIGIGIRTQHLCLEFTLIGQLDRDFVGLGNDMRIGQDMPVLIDDESRTQSLCLLPPLAWRRQEAAKELEERIVFRNRHHSPLIVDLACGADIDDSRTLLFHKTDKARQFHRLDRCCLAHLLAAWRSRLCCAGQWIAEHERHEKRRSKSAMGILEIAHVFLRCSVVRRDDETWRMAIARQRLQAHAFARCPQADQAFWQSTFIEANSSNSPVRLLMSAMRCPGLSCATGST